jgi:hypothetical protein
LQVGGADLVEVGHVDKHRSFVTPMQARLTANDPPDRADQHIYGKAEASRPENGTSEKEQRYRCQGKATPMEGPAYQLRCAHGSRSDHGQHEHNTLAPARKQVAA